MGNVGLRNSLSQLLSRAIVRDAVSTTVWSTMGKGVGFLVPFFIAAWFGVSSETDAFFFSYGIILFFAHIFSPVVETVIVPYIAEARTRDEDVGRFVGQIIGLSGALILLLSGLVILVVKPVLGLVTHFDQKSLQMAYSLLVETAPLMLLLIWTSVLSGALNAYKKFIYAAVSPAFRAAMNLTVIFLLKDRMGVHAVALGYILGELVRLAILFIAPARLKIFTLKISLKRDVKIREFIKTSSFQVFGMVAVGLNPVIDKIMASWMAIGTVTLLEYADRLIIIPLTLIESGFVVVFLSYMSERFYKSMDRKLLKKDLLRAAGATGLSSFLLMAFLMLIHNPLTRIAFGRGKFPLDNLKDVRILFLLLLIGLVPHTVNQILIRGLIILKNTKSLFKALLLRNFLKIILNLGLILLFGIYGIALATSISAFLVLAYVWTEFRRTIVRPIPSSKETKSVVDLSG
jgi:putative peptidoglycan lipid II flippase